MSVFRVLCMEVYCVCNRCPQKSEECLIPPGTQVRDACEAHVGSVN